LQGQQGKAGKGSTSFWKKRSKKLLSLDNHK
jgi:hypothetical protein